MIFEAIADIFPAVILTSLLRAALDADLDTHRKTVSILHRLQPGH